MDGDTLHKENEIGPQEFAQLVRHALAALYDYPRLQALPLAELLVATQPESARGAALHHLLLQAIEDLRPSSPSATTPAMRRYQYLYLRYVDVRSIADVAAMLGVSLRQARRDHHDALDVLASRLYEMYGAQRERSRSGATDGAQRSASMTRSEIPMLTLESEAGRIGLQEPAGQTSCDEVIASAIETLAPLALAHRVSLRHRRSDQPGTTSVDRALVRQILINAIGHVITRDPGGEVVLGSELTRDTVQITVEFEAAGGQPENGESESRLTVCRHLLSLVQGNLDLRVEGARAHLKVWLPGVAPSTVLVVDDNPGVRQLFRRYLAGGNYSVLEAGAFDEALEAARTLQPDVITLDVMLPVRDGWELLQRMKQDVACSGIPVVVCSVLRERDLAFALGAADFLEKPVTQSALLGAIARLLERSPRHQGQPEGSASSPAP